MMNPESIHMATITLKNVPEALLGRLKKHARRERRSVNQHAIHLLEQGLKTGGRGDEEKARRKRCLETWRRLAGTWESDESVQEEIRAITSARTGGRDVEP